MKIKHVVFTSGTRQTFADVLKGIKQCRGLTGNIISAGALYCLRMPTRPLAAEHSASRYACLRQSIEGCSTVPDGGTVGQPCSIEVEHAKADPPRQPHDSNKAIRQQGTGASEAKGKALGNQQKVHGKGWRKSWGFPRFASIPVFRPLCALRCPAGGSYSRTLGGLSECRHAGTSARRWVRGGGAGGGGEDTDAGVAPRPQAARRGRLQAPSKVASGNPHRRGAPSAGCFIGARSAPPPPALRILAESAFSPHPLGGPVAYIGRAGVSGPGPTGRRGRGTRGGGPRDRERRRGRRGRRERRGQGPAAQR